MKYIQVDSSELEVGDIIERTDDSTDDYLRGEVTYIDWDSDKIDILLSEDFEGEDEGEISDRCLSVGTWYRLSDSKKNHPRIKTKFLEGFQL